MNHLVTGNDRHRFPGEEDIGKVFHLDFYLVGIQRHARPCNDSLPCGFILDRQVDRYVFGHVGGADLGSSITFLLVGFILLRRDLDLVTGAVVHQLGRRCLPRRVVGGGIIINNIPRQAVLSFPRTGLGAACLEIRFPPTNTEE